MGMIDILNGYIIEASPGYGGGPEERVLKTQMATDIRKHNWSVVQQLPGEDRWPVLHPKMFYPIPDQHLLKYKDPLIIFGGSFKQIADDWESWLIMFEEMLRKMYWEDVQLSLHSEMIGTHHFRWKVKSDWFVKMCNRDLQPITEWDFTGTRNFFDGLNRID
jgi:hypothetical protein